MTNLTTSEINALAAEAAGGEPTRTSTKERAIAKLTAAVTTIVGAERAETAVATILGLDNMDAASAVLQRLRGAEAPAEPKRTRKAAAEKKPGKRASKIEAAQRGDLPPAPDFSAETHKRFRAKLAQVVAAAEAGDLAALRAFEINPTSSSPKAIAKYRDLAVIALEARTPKDQVAA